MRFIKQCRDEVYVILPCIEIYVGIKCIIIVILLRMVCDEALGIFNDAFFVFASLKISLAQ